MKKQIIHQIAIDLAGHNSGICYKDKIIKTTSAKTITDWKNFLETYRDQHIEFLVEYSNFRNQKAHVMNENELLGVIKTCCLFLNITYSMIFVNPRQWLMFFPELSVKKDGHTYYPKNLRKFFNKKTQTLRNDDEVDSYLIFKKFEDIKTYLNNKKQNKNQRGI